MSEVVIIDYNQIYNQTLYIYIYIYILHYAWPWLLWIEIRCNIYGITPDKIIKLKKKEKKSEEK